MKLAKLKIRNFRSFGDEEIIINFDIITTFIGANSTGKTATMQALVKLFGATLSEREIHRSDFHIEPSQLPEQLENCELYIEAVFVFPELENASDSTASIPSFFRYFVVDEQTKPPYLRIRLESSFLRDDTPEGSIDTQYSFITSSEKDDSITDQVRKPIQRYIMSNIKCIYIPALRDPSEQLRHVSGTILYRLLSGIRWSSDVKEKLTDLVSDLNNAYGAVPGVIELQDIIQTEWKKYHNDFRYSDAKIVFSATDISEILKKAEIKFSPTEIPRAYDVIELGDGLRSLFYFSLVNSLLNLESKILTTLSKQPTVEDQQGPQYTLQPPILTIVAVEEPENHIAPQLLGKVINNLEDMVNHANAQVILSSHTPAIVKRVDATSIRYFRLAEISQATIVKKISLPDKIIDNGNIYKYVKEGIEAYPEIYFARLVILGEGDSEALVIPRLFEKTKGSIDSFGISVVPLGGRHVNYFWKLLSDLCIPHLTLLDLDLERYGGGWGRIKYVIEQLMANSISRESLLAEGDAALTDEELQSFLERDVNETEKMDNWLYKLKEFRVFFSTPLDLDLLLLETFPKLYIDSIDNNSGPYIPKIGKIKDIEKLSPAMDEYEDRVKKNVSDVLGEGGGDGNTYSEEQKKLMVWYKYLFLDRSKPTNHLIAISQISSKITVDSLPEPLKTIMLISTGSNVRGGDLNHDDIDKT